MEHEERLDESFFRDPQWIAEQRDHQYLHENNVLFYFAQSPFFDRQSNNNSVFLQAISDPRFASWLANRDNFEAQLRRIAGTEYVVIHDPVTFKARHPNEEISNIWVIQKQARRKRLGQEDEITPLSLYYVVGDAIYQAPSVAKLIGNRMLSTVTSLNSLLSLTAPLPLFSPSNGHGYIQPSSSASPSTQAALSQQSKENTPIPDPLPTANSQPPKPALTTDGTEYEDTQTFLDALNLSRRFRNEYMDENLLVGEPGNFRTSKVREAPAMSKQTSANGPQLSPPTREQTSAPSPPPPVKTDVPPVASKKSAKGGEKSPTTPGGREKPKRRKSRPAVTPTES